MLSLETLESIDEYSNETKVAFLAIESIEKILNISTNDKTAILMKRVSLETFSDFSITSVSMESFFETVKSFIKKISEFIVQIWRKIVLFIQNLFSNYTKIAGRIKDKLKIITSDSKFKERKIKDVTDNSKFGSLKHLVSVDGEASGETAIGIIANTVDSIDASLDAYTLTKQEMLKSDKLVELIEKMGKSSIHLQQEQDKLDKNFNDKHQGMKDYYISLLKCFKGRFNVIDHGVKHGGEGSLHTAIIQTRTLAENRFIKYELNANVKTVPIGQRILNEYKLHISKSIEMNKKPVDKVYAFDYKQIIFCGESSDKLFDYIEKFKKAIDEMDKLTSGVDKKTKLLLFMPLIDKHTNATSSSKYTFSVLRQIYEQYKTCSDVASSITTTLFPASIRCLSVIEKVMDIFIENDPGDVKLNNYYGVVQQNGPIAIGN